MFHLLSNLTTKYDEQGSEQDVLHLRKRSLRPIPPALWFVACSGLWNYSETIAGIEFKQRPLRLYEKRVKGSLLKTAEGSLSPWGLFITSSWGRSKHSAAMLENQRRCCFGRINRYRQSPIDSYIKGQMRLEGFKTVHRGLCLPAGGPKVGRHG